MRLLSLASSLVVTSLFVAGCSGAEDDEAVGASTDALRACPVVPACDATPPPASRAFFRNVGNYVVSRGEPTHRGHDAFVTPGEPQWVIARFAYGILDVPLTDEDVDIFLLRGCGASWEKLGTARTTKPKAHATVDGVADDGGRVYFEIPASKQLAEGRHRVRLVAKGDGSATEVFLEVRATDTPLFVSDVDGTLTTSEFAAVGSVFSSSVPASNPGSAEALQALVTKGYRPLYLTARAGRLTAQTRRFLEQRGYPPGIVQTSDTFIGVNGDPAAEFKSDALRRVTARGYGVELGFGNTATDVEAYTAGDVPVSSAYFFKFTPARGTRIEDYRSLGAFASLPSTCP